MSDEDIAVRYDTTLLTEDDLYLFNEGSHNRLYEKLGAHPLTAEGVEGTYFAVWAPDRGAIAFLTGGTDSKSQIAGTARAVPRNVGIARRARESLPRFL